MLTGVSIMYTCDSILRAARYSENTPSIRSAPGKGTDGERMGLVSIGRGAGGLASIR